MGRGACDFERALEYGRRVIEAAKALVVEPYLGTVVIGHDSFVVSTNDGGIDTITDFAIGDGVWADFGPVANEIQIKFHLVVTAAPNKK